MGRRHVRGAVRPPRFGVIGGDNAAGCRCVPSASAGSLVAQWVLSNTRTVKQDLALARTPRVNCHEQVHDIDHTVQVHMRLKGLRCEPVPRIPCVQDEITMLLEAARTGSDDAVNRCWRMLYGQLHEIATGLLRQESDTVTVQPTQLVNEAWIRLAGGHPDREWQSRGHFFGSAARAMAHVLIDRGRRRRSLRHGEGRRPLNLDLFDPAAPADPLRMLESLDSAQWEPVFEAIRQLQEVSPRAADVAWLRIVAGLSIAQTAAALDVSQRTVCHDWVYVKARLVQSQAPQTDCTGDHSGRGTTLPLPP